MASKSDAPLRRAELVDANQRPEDDDGCATDDDDQQQLELEPQSAVDASKRRQALLRKNPPRTPPPARLKRSPPPLKRTARARSDVSDRRGANLPPMPLSDGADDESLALFRARFERGEFFARSCGASARPSQSA